MTIADDRSLVARFKAGDMSSFEQLVRKYQDRIYNLCHYMTRNPQDAQDAAQDIFLKAYGGLNSYSPDASLYTWLYRITVNTCLDYNKRSWPEPLENESFMGELVSVDPSPERLSLSRETGRLIKAALSRLPSKLSAVIVIREIEGLSYEEIAEVLNMSIGTVKSRIFKARDKLRRILKRKLAE